MKNTKTKLFWFSLISLITILLPITKSAGVVDFKLTELDSPPLDIIWCGSSRDTVITLTVNNSLYRSDDKGFSFKKLNDVLMHTGKQELEENDNEIGKVSRILESPVDKSLLIFLGTHGINWIGEDCGRRVKALNHGRKIQEYVFHPTERNWGLASAFTLCEDFTNGEPCKIYKELFVTRDLGENWDILGSYVVQFGWGVVDEEHIKSGVPKERILLSLEPRAKGHQNNKGWSYKIDFIYSDDFFKTKRIAAHKGNKFLLTKHYLFVAQVVDQESQEVMLLSSKSNEKYYNLQPIETTSKIFREHSYTFLDTSDISVFLNINHIGENSKYGNIYTSNADGTQYSLSLMYNVRSFDHKCDFQKVESIEGTYIANTISSDFIKTSEQELQEEEMQQDSMEEKTHSRNGMAKENAYLDYIETFVTFNKGGDWKRLTAPSRDINAKKYDCDSHSSCYLNLHGVTGDYATFYSVQSAAGIVIGNGNVGKFLTNNPEEISTFLSRDGGLSWFEVRKGSHIYEIGDHGALIVIADDQNPTDTVYYTWDEGITWQEIKISNEKMMIKNIIIEPKSTSQHFVIYGETHKKGEKKGSVIGLDFSSLHEPQCRNPDQPGTETSDYEAWTPNDGRTGHECLLGKKVIYIRRKREAECFNGMDFERKSVVEFCNCLSDDYECDVGFARSAPGEPCNPIHSNVKDHTHPDAYVPPEDCKGTFSISKGYRKVPGNSCVNGLKYDPIIVSCPNIFFALVGKSVVALLVAFLLVLIFLTLMSGNYFSKMGELMKPGSNVRKPEYVDIVRNKI
jgi:hypothetical protein